MAAAVEGAYRARVDKLSGTGGVGDRPGLRRRPRKPAIMAGFHGGMGGQSAITRSQLVSKTLSRNAFNPQDNSQPTHSCVHPDQTAKTHRGEPSMGGAIRGESMRCVGVEST